jgi:hypothetical protein
MPVEDPMNDDGNEYAETAGEPGEAADLPATTGRDPEAGTPDSPLEETP